MGRLVLHWVCVFVLVSLPVGGCSDDSTAAGGSGGTGGNGGGGGAGGTAGSAGKPSEIPPGVLQVRFEQVPYETTLDYVTDLAFTPDASGEFLAIDLYGKFKHARLDADGAVSLMSGRFDDV